MEKRVLVGACFALSIVGMVLLFFSKPSVSPQLIELDGTVKSVRVKGDVAFISFVPDNFEVVSFSGVNFEEGNVTLRGRLRQYKGRLEFVLDD
jgi:hypothetical protein